MSVSTVPASIRIRVEAGAALLDRIRPGWLDDIDLITLDLADPECCMLGQLYGKYRAGWPDAVISAELGFFADGPDREARVAEYAQLTEAWRDLVLTEAARRRAACCPCRGTVCDPGCECPDCPHSDVELTDDGD